MLQRKHSGKYMSLLTSVSQVNLLYNGKELRVIRGITHTFHIEIALRKLLLTLTKELIILPGKYLGIAGMATRDMETMVSHKKKSQETKGRSAFIRF